MFGISFAELIVVLILLLAVTNPKDIPGIARYLTKLFFKAKQVVASAKSEVNKIGDELGLEKIKNEAEAEVEKAKKTVIIDLYGNEHEVEDVQKLRGDVGKKALKKEIEEFNKKNSKSSAKKVVSKSKQNPKKS